MSHLSVAAPYFGGALVAHLASKALLPQTMEDAYSLIGCFYAWAMAFDHPDPKECLKLEQQVNAHIRRKATEIWLGLGCRYLSLGLVAVGLYKMV
jgi:hypothetical protein